METNNNKINFLKKLIVSIFIVGMLAAGTVLFFDPFFHYHKPIRPLKAVLNQAEYQVIGTLRTFDYDSLIAGSSMAENYNNRWFDENFNCKTVKAVKPGANTSDLKYLIDAAYEEREIKNIFYTLDISALTTEIQTHYVNEGMPLYLYNKNPFDDVQYLFNKHIIFKDIPYMIATSFLEDYDEGDSFNWAKYKEFSGLYYIPTEKKQPEKTIEEYGKYVDYNVSLLEEIVENHPETNFVFLVPPYSSIWWYEADMCGDMEINFYALSSAFEKLLSYENVEIHYFQDMEEIISNLDYYMDLIHYNSDINKKLVDLLKTDTYKVTFDNMEEKLQSMKQLSEKCINFYAKEYFATLE